MPLQDHFQPPLSARRHWNAFHNSWATYLSSQVNALLPPGYFAEANVQFGIEIDVATWEESPPTSSPAAGWTPGPAVLTIPLPLLTDIEAPSVTVALEHTQFHAEEHLENARPKSGMRSAFMNMANSIM